MVSASLRHKKRVPHLSSLHINKALDQSISLVGLPDRDLGWTVFSSFLCHFPVTTARAQVGLLRFVFWHVSFGRSFFLCVVHSLHHRYGRKEGHVIQGGYTYGRKRECDPLLLCGLGKVGDGMGTALIEEMGVCHSRYPLGSSTWVWVYGVHLCRQFGWRESLSQCFYRVT